MALGMSKRGGPCGPAHSPLVKNAGRADLFNPLTRISPPHISPRPANPQEKKIVIVLLCADDEKDYNYEKMDESSSKVGIQCY